MRTNDPRFFNRSLLENVDQIQAVDKATVRVTTKSPDATILSYLSADPPLVLAPEAVQKSTRFDTAESGGRDGRLHDEVAAGHRRRRIRPQSGLLEARAGLTSTACATRISLTRARPTPPSRRGRSTSCSCPARTPPSYIAKQGQRLHAGLVQGRHRLPDAAAEHQDEAA